MDRQTRTCKVFANFFAVKGQKKKGYLVDSKTMRIQDESSMEDYFRGRSDAFEDVLSGAREVHLGCFVFRKDRLYRVDEFEALDSEDEIYICEVTLKGKLLAYLKDTDAAQAGASTSQSGQSGHQIFVGEREISRKRKRSLAADTLSGKLDEHRKRKEEDKDYKRKERQNYGEREIVDIYRQYKGQSLAAFEEEYGDITWKKRK